MLSASLQDLMVTTLPHVRIAFLRQFKSHGVDSVSISGLGYRRRSRAWPGTSQLK
jgi:hypothetical protein